MKTNYDNILKEYQIFQNAKSVEEKFIIDDSIYFNKKLLFDEFSSSHGFISVVSKIDNESESKCQCFLKYIHNLFDKTIIFSHSQKSFFYIKS